VKARLYERRGKRKERQDKVIARTFREGIDGLRPKIEFGAQAV
jgi:hypothetical protein